MIVEKFSKTLPNPRSTRFSALQLRNPKTHELKNSLQSFLRNLENFQILSKTLVISEKIVTVEVLINLTKGNSMKYIAILSIAVSLLSGCKSTPSDIFSELEPLPKRNTPNLSVYDKDVHHRKYTVQVLKLFMAGDTSLNSEDIFNGECERIEAMPFVHLNPDEKVANDQRKPLKLATSISSNSNGPIIKESDIKIHEIGKMVEVELKQDEVKKTIFRLGLKVEDSKFVELVDYSRIPHPNGLVITRMPIIENRGMSTTLTIPTNKWQVLGGTSREKTVTNSSGKKVKTRTNIITVVRLMEPNDSYVPSIVDQQIVIEK